MWLQWVQTGLEPPAAGERHDPEDGFLYINTSEISKEGYIIKQYFKYRRRLRNFELGVLYRCNGTNLNNCIRDGDKIKLFHFIFILDIEDILLTIKIQKILFQYQKKVNIMKKRYSSLKIQTLFI